MKRDVLCYPALFHHFFQRFTDRPVVEIREHEVILLHGAVTLYYQQGYIQQFHLERYFRFVPFGQYPLLTVHFYDVVIGQFLDVHEREGGEAGENENITDIGQLGIPELMSHQRFQLIFRQVFTLLYIRADVELGKRVSRYQSVEVRTHDYTFQPHALFPYRPVVQSCFHRKVGCELLDEVRRNLQHGHIRPPVERLDERCHMVSCHHP